MNLITALTLIRSHWSYLADLRLLYPHELQQPRADMFASAAFRRLQDTILHETTASQWVDLYDVLRLEPHAAKIDARKGEQPILLLLWGLIDRRAEFGFRPVKASPAHLYPNKASRCRRGSRGKQKGAGDENDRAA